MKKFLVSMGLIAAGTAGLQAAYAPGLDSMSASKVWSVSGTLRGFYDDNYDTASSGSSRRGSFGFEASPQLGLNMALQQTELGARYTYGMYYYQDRENRNENPVDQTHQLDLWLDHAFTERWQAKVQDSFVVGQEPELIDPNGGLHRTEGDNIRNTGTIDLNTTWTRLFSTKLEYQNSIYDYQNNNGTPFSPSYAGTLNRIEQSVSLDLQRIIAPETMVFVGGAVSFANYTGDEEIAYKYVAPTWVPVKSDSRDSRSYFGYIGAQHNFLSNLSLTAKAGAQVTDNYNDPSGSTTSINPYADISLIYTYLPGSYAQLGFTQTENASQQVGTGLNNGYLVNNSMDLFTESSTIYASINHKLTSKLMGTVIGRWQHSVYNGGYYDNTADDYYSMGLNLSYSFNSHFSAEAGYNLDYLQSKIPGNEYSRNRVYLGVSAAY
jgi:hypothetical protein